MNMYKLFYQVTAKIFNKGPPENRLFKIFAQPRRNQRGFLRSLFSRCLILNCSQITETKCSSETVVAAEFHPLEGRTIVTVGKGFVNFWALDQTSLTLSRKTGIFDQRDKPKVSLDSLGNFTTLFFLVVHFERKGSV